MLTPRNLMRSVGPAIALLLLAGCGPSMGKVDGKVVWDDGKPAGDLAGSLVVFESAEMKLSARGNIEPDGTFKIGTNSADDGLPLGEYEVAVMEHRVTPEGAAPPPAKLDLKFSALKTSGLKVTIKGGTNPVTLTLGHPAKKRVDHCPVFASS